MPLSPQFAAAASALLTKLQQQQADLDYQEQARNRLYGTQEAAMNEQHPINQRRLNSGMADRGLVQSGVNLAAQGRLNRAFTEGSGALLQERNNDLAGFGRNRQANQTDYNLGYADLQARDADFVANQIATGQLKSLPGTGPQVNAPPYGTGSIKPVVKKKPVPKKTTGGSTVQKRSPIVPKIKTVAKRPPTSRLVNY